jgi:predicted DNA-binding transcriptional regulator AlpA
VSEWLMTREVADRLAVSIGALLRWTKRGDVPAVWLPSGAIRYRPEAIDAWIAKHETGRGRRRSVTDPNEPRAPGRSTGTTGHLVRDAEASIRARLDARTARRVL